MHISYGAPQPLTPHTTLVLADNPSPMTLEGTQSYLLRGFGRAVVIDPGPNDPAHLQLLADDVALILLTHRHADHSAGVQALHEATGAPVRAVDPAWCREAAPLADREVIDVDGLSLLVLHTPGHTSDSASFVLGDELFSGDTLLGRGTTIIDFPDGSLADYLDSLRTLRELPDLKLHPAHGGVRDSTHAVLDEYLAHREQRLEQVRAAIEQLGGNTTAPNREALLSVVYPDLDADLRGAALRSLDAQLSYLRERG